jgi:hypothetical protein
VSWRKQGGVRSWAAFLACEGVDRGMAKCWLSSTSRASGGQPRSIALLNRCRHGHSNGAARARLGLCDLVQATDTEIWGLDRTLDAVQVGILWLMLCRCVIAVREYNGVFRISTTEAGVSGADCGSGQQMLPGIELPEMPSSTQLMPGVLLNHRGSRVQL